MATEFWFLQIIDIKYRWTEGDIILVWIHDVSYNASQDIEAATEFRAVNLRKHSVFREIQDNDSR